MSIEPFVDDGLRFDRGWLEEIILNLGDAFSIRIEWNRNTAILTGVFAVAGGALGGYAGGKLGATLGTGLGGITGLGVSTIVSLREIWATIKEKLKELLYIVFNYLRRMNAADYINAFEIIMTCCQSRYQLVKTIVEFIAEKLCRRVTSSISY